MGTRERNRRYALELSGAMAVYALLLFGVASFIGQVSSRGLKILVALLPMIGVALAMTAIARHLRTSDEYVRKVSLESLAIAAGATAGCTLTWGFLEGVGFPRLSMFVVWPVMAFAWVVAAIACRVKGR